jgi:hypothetical protein
MKGWKRSWAFDWSKAFSQDEKNNKNKKVKNKKIGNWYGSRAFDWSKVFCQDGKIKKIKNGR